MARKKTAFGFGGGAQVQGVPRSIAADRLGVSRQRIHQLVQMGALSEVTICGTALVSVGSLTALLWNREMSNNG